ncbi:MAG TPA: hypothetical protein VMW56_07735 [Candidatus Margulisiibacteriota bacterium]|nr:hypothetical protein [Candidatus Margulisiibacteriota bacterium]
MEHADPGQHVDPHGTGGGHEERDVSFAPLVRGLMGLIALVIVSAVLMRVLFGYLAGHEAAISPRPNPLAQSFGRQVPPEPRLQPDPLQDLQTMRAQEDALLNSYGWVDRKAGVVRIPVQRALELLAQRGLPARQPAAGEAP